MADFYDNPELYDVLLPVGAHLPLYLDLARQQAGTVLELACGTGLLTVPIAAAGLAPVGLDQSSAMLSSARKRASAANVAIDFVEGDMRDFELGRRFNFIFVARNSLLHLLSTEDLLAAFRAVKRHLAPNGIFAFDVFNPDVRILARPADRRFSLMEVTTDAFGPLRVEASIDYDAAEQVNHSTWSISTPNEADKWVFPLTLRSIFPQELPLLLSAGGLELVQRFGDLSREPFVAASPRQICLCRAAD